MAFNDNNTSYQWMAAKGLMAASAQLENGPQGALVPDQQQMRDHVAVVYDRGETPPEITIKEISGSVHSVLANGVAVAVIASSREAAPTASDVILVERTV